MYTIASLKAEYKTLAAAKAAHNKTAGSWKALAGKLNEITIEGLQEQVKKLEAENAAMKKQMASIQKSATSQSSESSYFVSPEAEIIYNITKLDGEARLKALGVNRSHYKDAKKAKDWRNNLAMKVHPDYCTHSHAARAMDEITSLYENMVAA